MEIIQDREREYVKENYVNACVYSRLSVFLCEIKFKCERKGIYVRVYDLFC